MSFPTIIHERVDQARRGSNPKVICRLKSGWVVLGDEQRLRGYSLLLADPIHEHLNTLDYEQRCQFLGDMAVIGDALLHVVQASLINYSILGNSDRALHAHIHPRYEHENPDQRRMPPFIYQMLKFPSVPFDPARDQRLMVEMRQAIVARTGVIA